MAMSCIFALTSNAVLNYGTFFTDYTGTSADPYIEYNEVLMAKVNGVTDGNIAKVDGTTNANMIRINTITDSD